MGIMLDNYNAEGTSVIDTALDHGALFEVKTQPMTIGDFVPTISDGAYAGEPEKVIHYREDGGEPFVLNVAHPSHPSSNYLQVIETAETLFPGTCTGMAVVDGGKKLFFTQELGDERDLGGGETLSPHVMWRASLDSSWSTGCHGLGYRAFCTNQIPMSKAAFKVRRSTNHDLILAERSRIMAMVLDRFDAFCEDVSALRRIPVSGRQFREIRDRLIPAPAEDAHGKTVNTYERKIAAVSYYFGEESDGPAAGTAWAVYNAFQSAELHSFTEGAHKERKTAEIVAEGRFSDLSRAARAEVLALA